MTELDTFDLQLRRALLDYAAEAPTASEPFELAARIAAADPRRASGSASWRWLRLRPVWVVLAILLLAAAAGAALVGIRLMQDPAPPLTHVRLPDELWGRWQVADGSGEYIDLHATSVLHGADGRAEETFGTVVGFIPREPGAIDGTLLVRAPLPCGDARYTLTYEDLVNDIPSPPPVGDAFRLVDPVDSCAARRSLLADRRWERMAIMLAAGGTYGSLDFSEPFVMRLPGNVAWGLPDQGAIAGTLWEFTPGQLQFSHPWWNAAMIDDLPVYRDLCDHSIGTLPDIPASVEAVGSWLTAATRVRFGPATELSIDGRRALRWRTRDECGGTAGIAAASDLAFGFDFYAIPTGDDIILFVVRPDTSNEADVAERIALSLDFD